MENNIQVIGLFDLAVAFIPVLIGLLFIYYWSLNVKQASYALARMLLQLLLIGYLLSYIFFSDSSWLILAILLAMVTISSWIALRTLQTHRFLLFKYGFAAILFGGGFTLIFISQGALNVTPWYQPQVLIPLAGMIFANAMNSVSLSAERVLAELKNNADYAKARVQALNAATIPVINSLFAVGLVSLPGMMTGQILSGVSPLIAARYQIIVMCMIFASSVISAVLFLLFGKKALEGIADKNRD
jgi:putative ABC transport system permease protein